MDNSPSRLGLLIFARLAAMGNPPTRSVLDQALKPYFSCRLSLSDGQWRTLLEKTLEELFQGKWIETKPYRLTEIGWAVCLQFLNLKQRPQNCSWVSLRNRQLIAHALNIAPQSPAEWKRLASADGLRAAVLVKFHQLPIDPLPTMVQALDALANLHQTAKTDEVPTPLKSATREELLRETLIPNQLGALKVRLPAIATKAQNNSIESLRQAVINHWLNGCDENECSGRTFNQPQVQPLHQSSSPRESEFNVQDFAERILDLARLASSGQFGENKVFLSHLWASYDSQSALPRITREQFDEQLFEANRQNLITLSRADLITAMDPKDVEDSEISLPHATFHFIRTDEM